jgi:xylulokinase
MWVRDNEPEIYEATHKTLNAKDYIVFKLTGAFYTEPSDASSNACVDLATLDWSERLIEYAGVDSTSSEDRALHLRGGRRHRGRGAGRPASPRAPAWSWAAATACAPTVGAGSVRPGKSFSYIGSSAWIATTSEKPVLDEAMRTVTWAHIVPACTRPTAPCSPPAAPTPGSKTR